MHIVPHRPGFPLESHRVADYAAITACAEGWRPRPRGGGRDTYPEPVPHCGSAAKAALRPEAQTTIIFRSSRASRGFKRGAGGEWLIRSPNSLRSRCPFHEASARREQGYTRVREQARIQRWPYRASRPRACRFRPGFTSSSSPGRRSLCRSRGRSLRARRNSLLFGWAIRAPNDDAGWVYHRRWAPTRPARGRRSRN
jgi:hypothetical protein